MANTPKKTARLTAEFVSPPASAAVRRQAVINARNRALQGEDELAAWRGWELAISNADTAFMESLGLGLRKLEERLAAADTAWKDAIGRADQASYSITKTAYETLHRQLALAEAARAAIEDPARETYENAIAEADRLYRLDIDTARKSQLVEVQNAIQARDMAKQHLPKVPDVAV